MGKMKKCLFLVFLLVFSAIASGWAQTPARESGEGILVGRIAHVEGQLLRYVPEEKDWVATVQDAPFGLDDSLYAEAKAKAELIMPNNTWLRIGGSTQLQLLSLRTDVTEVDAGSGMVRLYNRNPQGVIKATSPFGYVVAPADTVFDLYVGDRSLEVIALKGKVDFVMDGDQSKYEVTAGGSSIVSDGRQATSGQGNVDADWDDWNRQRDQLWTKRTEVKGESVRYLPPALHDESYALDENGRWEQVYYEGQYRRFWRPLYVSAGWAPFTAGRWTVYYGDNCWIPYEPFGYLTHHYGNWVFVNTYNSWYWAPPVVNVGVNFGPFLGIGFGWYPGRVGWIYSGFNVGWVPLAPFEPYYCRRWWGPRTMVVNNVQINNININRYQYINRAVIVNQKNFYSVNNYQNVRVANINGNTIVNNYRAAPVVNNTVIRDYNSMRDRYNFTNVRVEHKPHDTVLNRISHNEQIARTAGGANARGIEQDVAAFRPGKPTPEAKIETPRVTDRLVRQQDGGRPTNDLQLPQRELRERSKPPAPIVTGQGQAFDRPADPTGKETQPGETRRARTFSSDGQTSRSARPGQESQATQQGKSQAVGDEGQRVRPTRPDSVTKAVEPGQLGTLPRDSQRVRPPRPGQELQATEPGQPKTFGEQATRVSPGRSGGDAQPAEPGQLKSPLENSRKVRQPKPQQDLQAPGSIQAGPTGQATEQGQRLRSSKPGGSITQPDQAGQVGQQPSDSRQRARPSNAGRDIQSSQPQPGAIQAPYTGNQRSGQPGAGGEVRQRNSRPAASPMEQNKNAVIPQEQPLPQGSVSPPAPSRQPAHKQTRSYQQKESAVQTLEPPPSGGMAVPQAPQFESGPRSGGPGQKAAPAEGPSRGRGRGAGND